MEASGLSAQRTLYVELNWDGPSAHPNIAPLIKALGLGPMPSWLVENTKVFSTVSRFVPRISTAVQLCWAPEGPSKAGLIHQFALQIGETLPSFWATLKVAQKLG